ncbi:MAG: hypothetical protein NZ893_01665 [Candidatus Aenigmarchaeota archaeon]|nr:hypothetical protein [Candidatus Aenigmarchaeota archaeon]
MKTKILFLIILIFTISLLFVKEKKDYLKPRNAKDSDGTDSGDIIKNMENGYELVSLKTNPYGFVEVYDFENKGLLKEAYAIFHWEIESEDAGNIYVGYSFDGKNYVEKGPFNESGKIKVKLPSTIFSSFKNLRLRFRGEDLDFAADAIVKVKIYLQAIYYSI